MTQYFRPLQRVNITEFTFNTLTQTESRSETLCQVRVTRLGAGQGVSWVHPRGCLSCWTGLGFRVPQVLSTKVSVGVSTLGRRSTSTHLPSISQSSQDHFWRSEYVPITRLLRLRGGSLTTVLLLLANERIHINTRKGVPIRLPTLHV